MIIRKRVAGLVEYNGQFADVQIVGVEGLEKGLFLASVQLHRENTGDSPDEFQYRFSIGTCLEISITTEVSVQNHSR